MIIYAWILFALLVLGLGVAMGKDDGKDAGVGFLKIAIWLPILGRVLGWW